MPPYVNDPVVSTTDNTREPAVKGVSSTLQGIGVQGQSTHSFGTYGESRDAEGVRGVGHAGAGVSGNSERWIGVYGESTSGVGVQGKGGRLAGLFEGDVEVTGDIRLTGQDLAEHFDVTGADRVEPGTVMVLGDDGALRASRGAYDKRVAGVISGAGDYKPAIVLGGLPPQPAANRQPIALMGKVFCKVDARFGAVDVGDLLTTSATPGHAMKATNRRHAFGAVIGKALRPLKDGQGLIPILIALQ